MSISRWLGRGDGSRTPLGTAELPEATCALGGAELALLHFPLSACPAWLSNVVAVPGFDTVPSEGERHKHGGEMTWRSPVAGWDGLVSSIKSCCIRCKCHSGYCGHPMLPYYESTQIPWIYFIQLYAGVKNSRSMSEWIPSYFMGSKRLLYCASDKQKMSLPFHTVISLSCSALSPVAWKGWPEGEGGN